MRTDGGWEEEEEEKRGRAPTKMNVILFLFYFSFFLPSWDHPIRIMIDDAIKYQLHVYLPYYLIGTEYHRIWTTLRAIEVVLPSGLVNEYEI